MTSSPVPEPYAVSAPSGARPLGVAPFLSPGDVVMWRYRDHSWVPGKAETPSPMRVVRDDSSSFERGERPFDPTWTAWRPDPTWTVPRLGKHERWVVDLVD
ncbi:hypothetical protein GCM10009740_00440 [Terrabacter terrae]|uniref:DUF402 domain-containing protein n=1 Tax=Terrabacter terrae TaxID=318434 RepID=A0ABN2TPS7_9MICO